MPSDHYLTAENEHLRKENKRLREALEGIRELSHGGDHEIWLVAGEALREHDGHNLIGDPYDSIGDEI